jgi:hypothetical protein
MQLLLPLLALLVLLQALGLGLGLLPLPQGCRLHRAQLLRLLWLLPA